MPRKPAAVPKARRLTHGLTSATDILVRGEYADDWLAFSAAVLDDLGAVGEVETELATRVAGLLWRLRRAIRQETQIIEAAAESDLQAARREEWLANDSARLQAASDLPMEEDLLPVVGFYQRMNQALERFPHPTPAKILDLRPSIELVMRYETHLNRQLTQALALLDALQRRRGHPVDRHEAHVSDVGAEPSAAAVQRGAAAVQRGGPPAAPPESGSEGDFAN